MQNPHLREAPLCSSQTSQTWSIPSHRVSIVVPNQLLPSLMESTTCNRKSWVIVANLYLDTSFCSKHSLSSIVMHLFWPATNTCTRCSRSTPKLLSPTLSKNAWMRWNNVVFKPKLSVKVCKSKKEWRWSRGWAEWKRSAPISKRSTCCSRAACLIWLMTSDAIIWLRWKEFRSLHWLQGCERASHLN